MSATDTKGTGSAERWGPLWGARPDDWAACEEQQTPGYEEAIRQVGIAPGERVLDIGCGSGVFLRLAADAGARVSGIDASRALLSRARSRVPEAELREGDMQSLPFANRRFDLVTGFNAFFFAQDMVAALREAGRVASAGAPVLIQVFGRPERCDLEAVKAIMRPFLPPPPPGAPAGPALWSPGVLEELARTAGLEPRFTFDFSYPFEYADEQMLGRRLLAPAGFATLVGADREDAVRRQIVDALEEHRRADGSYSLVNEFHTLVAAAPRAA